MYICIKSGNSKEFIKCQSFKPVHLLKGRPPYNFKIEESDIARNPFDKKTTIDCDKSFCVKNVVVDKGLVTINRNDVCEELFDEILYISDHEQFKKNHIDITSFVSLNFKVKPAN
jgi:hypothetical protein